MKRIIFLVALVQLSFLVETVSANPQNKLSKSAIEGKALFATMNCASCHTVGQEGGCLGPPLAGVGSRRTKGFLEARLTNTKEAELKFQSEYSYHAELMPHPRFAPETANKLIAYLQTLPSPKGGFQIEPHKPLEAKSRNANEIKEATAADIAEGARNFYKFGCAACHSIGNIGGSLGPALDGVGGFRDLDFITDHITDAQIHTRMLKGDEGTSKMPHFKATEKEIDQIAAFLYTLKSKK
ncbi:MAG: cytochrome c [Candidatus Obscuribacterales bacterium]|nr:cytochrome c [Candidatus Obscuribacterales bacterium]